MGLALNFVKQGDADNPLVILHGLFGSARNWQGVAKQLAQWYSVYALDLRNHGSSPHSDAMDYGSMAADVLAFMEQQSLEKVTVLGHSMGGKVAMELALITPNKISQLVIVDIAPVTYTHNFNDVLAGFYHVPLEEIHSRKEADEYLAEKIDVPSLRQFLLQNLLPNPSGGYQWRVNLSAIEANMPAIMAFPSMANKRVFDKPSLFIRGEQSTYLASRYQNVIKEMFSNAEFETIKNAGHWPHIESPVDFMAVLNKFLA